MLKEEIVIKQPHPTEYYQAHFADEPFPIGYGATIEAALFNLLRGSVAQDRLQLRIKVVVSDTAMPIAQAPEEPQDTLFHPAVLSGAFIVVFTALLGILAYYDRPFLWWQVPPAMIGLSTFWDFGWHAWQHHLSFWPSHWLYRATGVALGLAALLPSLF